MWLTHMLTWTKVTKGQSNLAKAAAHTLDAMESLASAILEIQGGPEI